MATVTVVAQLASQALNGQSVTVYLNNGDQLNTLPSISAGQVCTLSSSSVTGTVYSVDYKGNSFKIIPTRPSGNLQSTSTPGYLAAGETISIVQ